MCQREGIGRGESDQVGLNEQTVREKNKERREIGLKEAENIEMVRCAEIR